MRFKSVIWCFACIGATLIVSVTALTLGAALKPANATPPEDFTQASKSIQLHVLRWSRHECYTQQSLIALALERAKSCEQDLDCMAMNPPGGRWVHGPFAVNRSEWPAIEPMFYQTPPFCWVMRIHGHYPAGYSAAARCEAGRCEVEMYPAMTTQERNRETLAGIEIPDHGAHWPGTHAMATPRGEAAARAAWETVAPGAETRNDE